MSIWSAEIKELEKLYESFKCQLPDLEKELERLIKADDENMILLYSRRCLEVIITDLCECELKRDRGTEPLKGIIDKLNKEKKVPPHIISSMNGLNELSTYGTHPKDFDPEQVKPVLNNLLIAVKWYQKYRETKERSPILNEAVNIKDYDLNKNLQIDKKVITKERTYKRLKNRILMGVLFIIALLTLIIFYLTFFAIGGGSYTRSEEILNNGIKFHDFLNRWDNYQGKVHLTTFVADQNDPSNEIIEIKTKEDYWKCTTISADSTYVRGIKDGNCFKEIDSILYEGNDQIKKHECSDMQFFRGHHYLHFGTLMELKRSGLILERKVKTAKFQGLKCLELVFQNDTSKTRNMFFKRTGPGKITVYLDPQNYSMKGYKTTGSYDFYVVFSGFLNINSITIPKCKAYYNNSDNSFKWVDLFTAAE